MPAPEKEMVSHLIEQILTCDFDNMISEYLVSEFWHRFSHKAAHRYSDCVKRLGVSIFIENAHICFIYIFNLPTLLSYWAQVL